MSASAAPVSSRVDLDALFRCYHRELTACAYRRLRDRDATADVVQDALVGCLARGKLEQATNPRGLLRHMVDCLAIDVARRQRRRVANVQVDTLADTLADPYPTVDRWVAARQDYALVKRALDELPPAPRSCSVASRASRTPRSRGASASRPAW